MSKIQLPEPVRLKVVALGDVGKQWMSQLEQLVAELEQQWQIKTGRVLHGGSASLAIYATCADGQLAVLKISLPDAATDLASQAKVLNLANGHGYIKLLAHDPSRNAILVERLGKPLAQQELSVDQQIEIICNTLKTTWVPLDANNGLMSGAEKAKWLAEFITKLWHELNEPCAKSIIDKALLFAEERGDMHDPTQSVLVHGDAHAHNILQSLTQENQYKFIDPDGLFAEPAYDLAIPMREWNDELLAGDPLALGIQRCELLSHLTSVDPHAIWQWGFIERVSTGLFLYSFGMKELGGKFLTVADHWSKR